MKQNISTYKENSWQEADFFFIYFFCVWLFLILVNLDIFVNNLYLLI